MAEQISNNAQTTLSGSLTNVATTLTVTSATGFPTSGDFRVLISAEGANTDEILTVTAVSGTTFTIARATEATAGVQTASAHASGATIAHVLTAGALRALNLLEQHTASASATLDFTTCISGTYDDYQVELINVIPATNSVTLYMRFSTDGGSSYLATSYGWNHLFVYGAGSNGAEGSTSDVAIAVSGAAVASAGYGVSGTLRLYDPGASGTTLKVLTKDTTRDHTSVGLVHDNGSGYRSVAAVNAIRFLFSSGNIASGTIRVYGIAK